MRVNIDRLRSWMLALAGLLVLGILGFFGYARWQIHRVGRDLPGKLGISIQQSTEGFTFSKSNRGHTIFTLHAAKTVQYKGGGHAELHDVSITLYGAGGAPADHIYGDDFEYDPAKGIVRANGDVQIDLQETAAPASSPAPPAAGEGNGSNVVHVKTAGLVFNQKTGMASTSQPIEFHIAQTAGSATGASFDSRRGVIILDRDVAIESSLGGTPLLIHARHAQFDRTIRKLYLLAAATDYQGSHSSSDAAVVSFRPDNSAFQIEAQGHVVMSDGAQKVTSQRARADLDAKSRPQQVILDGGLLYVAQDQARLLHGSAAEGTLSFGPGTSVRHAQLRNTVSLVDAEEAGTGQKDHSKNPGLTTREAEASQIDVDFTQGPNHKSIARQILATGSARLKISTVYAGTPPQETEIQGDEVLATLRNGAALSSLRAEGHTKLVQISPAGMKQTSTADNLSMTFAPSSGQGAAGRRAQLSEPQQPAQLESVEQQGHVTITEQSPVRQSSTPSPSSQAGTTATAGQAVYDAATQLVRLSGSPRLRNGEGELTASTIAFDRATGNAVAKGGVKATYHASTGQPGAGTGSTEPVHVAADHAHLDHAKDLSTFYGNAQQEARLWQGADSISAPVIELSRGQRSLAAYAPSTPAGGSSEVIAVLRSGTAAAGGKVPGKTRDFPGRGSVIQVSSRALLYSDVEEKALFEGGVVARNSSGTMHSRRMEIYFTNGVAKGGNSRTAPARQPGIAPGGEVERIVAEGDVQLDEPGRKATGEELVYTAADGRFVLTGSRSAPPRLVDEIHGTVTGGSLIFNDRDDSVMVRGGLSRAVTETRIGK